MVFVFHPLESTFLITFAIALQAYHVAEATEEQPTANRTFEFHMLPGSTAGNAFLIRAHLTSTNS